MKSGITYQVSYITIIDSKDNKNNSQVYVHKSADKVGSLCLKLNQIFQIKDILILISLEL